ncbi:RagB/SusD family nutrient uptake outer membrane protein [Sphingobacterium shayense]|uniref:RagB/SusD family nutrient uptake outer membrane protein n=1 Tax=Sphingobacterium shayense TaxID=626343 RepID=UPI0015562AA6|nr:RagB/SusD family nutrient uptake outer membrane protein [Sphingobacterium shayense]NQD69981.1 RagB/SusD family nutrient uptake outer membrane protein [Sphingobacterium shayense]
MKVKSISILVVWIGFLCSCSHYLDEKPDRSLAVPDNLRDLQALLDDEDRMIMNYPAAGDIAADYYFLDEADWLSRTVEVRDTYVWDEDAQNVQDWTSAYQRIFYANVVLDAVDEAEKGDMTELERAEVKGSAYFFRGWTYMQLAQLFCPYYGLGVEDSEYGLPLKIHADITEPIVRSSLKETYELIFDDLTHAVHLLPTRSIIATRPSKHAAYGALARLNLIIGDYQAALSYADSCLAINDQLLDYNDLEPSSAMPFEILNREVIFHAVIQANSGVHHQSLAYVDSLLIDGYEDGDLRKDVFFVEDENGRYRFKGGYHGSNSSIFGGLALDEIYLIRAECLTRLGSIDQAIEILVSFMKTRMKENSFIAYTGMGKSNFLELILKEREKQLLFRGGIRWSDLRRLNREERSAKNIQRRIGNTVYKLVPSDLRYTFLLPLEVIQISGIAQNPR